MAKKKMVKKKSDKKEKKDNTSPIATVKQACDMINKDFGAGTIHSGGNIIEVESFPSELAGLDDVLGVGGIPRGRIMEIYGPESSGKTTLTLKLLAAAQNRKFDGKDATVAFVDAEHALDPDWAERNGVDVDALLISQPDSGEDALNIVNTLVRAKVPLIVVDSVAALVPKAELHGEVGDHHVGAQARMMSQALRKLKGICSKYKSNVVFVNQIREKIGVIFGSPETTPGGRALKFYASIRIALTAGSPIKNKKLGGDEPIGKTTIIKIKKNKVARPFREIEVSIWFNHPILDGMDTRYSLFMSALDEDIIKVSGSSFKFGNIKLGQGKDNAIEKLCDDKELLQKIHDAYYSIITPDYMKDPEFLKKLEEESAKDIEEKLDDIDASDEADESDNFDQEE